MGFNKTKDFIICIDSDGTAIDTMNIKHNECFGPCLINEFQLNEFNKNGELIKKWGEINLFSLTRGVNRFKTQYYFLDYVNENIAKINGIEDLKNWTENSSELSNSALKAEIEKSNSEILRKTLAWSLAVNEAIEELPVEKKKSFSGVRKILEYVKEYADIAIVSSANHEALVTEWEEEKLMQYVDILMSQNDGSKKYCISKLLEKGYKKENLLMMGDAPADLDSAKANGVFFYPILVNKETESWEEFKNKGFKLFLDGNYSEYNASKEAEFYDNLK